MKRRRVKITGIGPVTPAGIGKDAFWKGIQESVSRVRPFNKLGKDYGPLVAAHIDDFDIRRYADVAKVPNGSARQTLFAIAGACLALEDAGISREELTRMNCAIVTGSSIMDFGGILSSIDAVFKHGVRGAKPRTMYTINTSNTPSSINEALGISARTMAVQSACCGGMDAIGNAAALVAAGEVDMAICGGTEAPLHRFPLLELRAAGLTPLTVEMPERLDRPFDLWRTTGVVSEGASMFIIEPEWSSRPGYSYIVGYGSASDESEDLCGGLVQANKLAMAEARIRPNNIDSINAWGPGHKLVDAAEAKALENVFGSSLPGIPAVSIKGAIGTPLGAAPAIQMAAAALAQRHGVFPPTVNWDRADPECPLNLNNRSRLISNECTLINAHGLGGVNACLILERC